MTTTDPETDSSHIRLPATLPDRPVSHRKEHSLSARAGMFFSWTAMLVYALLSIIPMIWLAIAPSKNAQQLNGDPPFSFGSVANYGVAWNNLMTFQDGVLVRWLMNSVTYTAAIVAISCVTALLAGYALAVTSIPYKRSLLIVTLVAMVVPPVALVIPLFIEISTLGLYNTPAAVILTSAFFPFGVFLAYIYMSTSIPHELWEAARVDGAGDFMIFWRVALPLSKGLFGMLAFFSFSAQWVNYFLPYVLLGSTENFTLPVGLGVLFSSTPALNPGNGAQQSVIGRPEIALAGLVLAIPILIVFLSSSRLLVRGVLSGSVKS